VPGDSRQSLFTIGHSNHSLQRFAELLRGEAIEVVADVRSAPYSRYCPWFSRDALARALPGAGPGYVFLGNELGGRPDGREFYDADGHVLYAAVAQAPFFAAGLERLREGMSRYRVALMCSEEDPTDCHRFLLVARELAAAGANVRHIRGDGRIETQEEVDDRYESHSAQQTLIARPRRSTRPVASGQPDAGH